MKKLMIALASIVMAVGVQAASVSWSITNVYSPSDSTAKVAASSMSAWLFVTANSTDVTGIKTTTLSAVQAVLDSGDLTGLADLAAANASNSSAGSIGGMTGLTGFSSGSLTAFAVVVDSTSLATAENYFLASGGAERTATFTSATGAKALAFGDQTSYTQGAGKWTSTSVPEPTSGLLMLLGMAGLALRRKRA